MYRYWRTAAAAVGLAATITAGVLWHVEPGQEDLDPSRPLLSRFRQDSVTYLRRHAQPGVTCPAAATQCFHWDMQDAAGNLTDDMSGTAAVLTAGGSPVYRIHTPIPDTTGFTGWRGIWTSNGDTNGFTGALAATGDQTTNDFSFSFWYYATTQGAAAMLLSKRAGGGQPGYILYLNVNVLTTAVRDPGAVASGAISGALAIRSWHYVTVNYDRSGNAYAYTDGVDPGVTLNIAGVSGTLTTASTLKLFRDPVAAVDLDLGAMSDLLIANGLTTLAEHQATYKAFTVPIPSDLNGVEGPITYVQTTTRKYALPPEAGFGVRLGVYAGSATAPQWPVSYSSTLVDAATNPLGTAFPTRYAITNHIGRSNEFASWTTGGAAPPVVAYPLASSTGEAPDGSVTAAQVTFGNGASTLTKTVVAGGNILAGETWGGSLYYRYISGTACDIRLYNGTTTYVTLNTTGLWARAEVISRAAGEAKQLLLSRNAGTTCIYTFSDAQYESNAVTSPCTTTPGNVTQTCNVSYFTQSWANRALRMPNSLERGEVVTVQSSIPLLAPDVYEERVVWELGQLASFRVGHQPVGLLYGRGGALESITRGKPIGSVADKRKYTYSWDTRNGLTNTSPRRYAALQIDDAYQATPLEARSVAAANDPSTPPTQYTRNAYTLTVGGKTVGATHSAHADIQSINFYGRPAQVVKQTDTTLVAAVDVSGPAFEDGQNIPRFSVPTGTTSTSAEIFDMADLSGSLYGRLNGIALAPTGTPLYQQWSGLQSRGQGRRGVHGANGTSFAAPNAGVLAIGANTAWAVAAIIDRAATSDNTGTIADTTNAGAGQGYYVYTDAAASRLYCRLIDNAANDRSCFVSSATLLPTTGDWDDRVVTCSWTQTAGNWNDPVVTIDGVSYAPTCAGGVPTGAIANTGALTLYRASSGGVTSFAGEFREFLVQNAAITAADALALYQQTVEYGTYWPNTSSVLGHYLFNEFAVPNGFGLFDQSGNANNLTVVAGTATPQFRDAQWPLGSGFRRPAVSTNNTEYFSSNAYATLKPDNAQPYTLAAWVRVPRPNTTFVVVTNRVGSAGLPYFLQGVENVNGFVQTTYYTSSAVVRTITNNSCGDLRDGQWHLIVSKIQWDGDSWNATSRCDDTNFLAWTDVGDAGNMNTAANYVEVARGGENLTLADFAGAAFFKNYNMTDAVAAALYPIGTDPSGLLAYTRSNTVCHETGNDPVTGLRARCWLADQMPVAYTASSVLTRPANPRGVAQPVHALVTNRSWTTDPYLGFWSATNVNYTAAEAPESIDGAKTATVVSETAVNNVHTLTLAALGYVLPQNSYITHTAYYRYGTTQWSWHFVGESAASHRAYCNVDTLNGVVGLIGTTGANWANVTCTVTGVARGWLRAELVAMCNRAGGCTIVPGMAMSNGNSAVIPSYLGVVTNNVAVAGFTTVDGTSRYLVHCPSYTNAAVTCGPTTSNVVAAASLATWTRSAGTTVSSLWPLNATGYGFDLHNGVNLNGAVRALYPTVETYIYNDSAVLQQRVGLASAQTATPRACVTQWDSTGTFFTDQGGTARRSFGNTFTAGSYTGYWPTYTTDTAANWTPAAGTNLHVGMDNAAGNLINGLTEGVYIWSTR